MKPLKSPFVYVSAWKWLFSFLLTVKKCLMNKYAHQRFCMTHATPKPFFWPFWHEFMSCSIASILSDLAIVKIIHYCKCTIREENNQPFLLIKSPSFDMEPLFQLFWRLVLQVYYLTMSYFNFLNMKEESNK